MLQAHTLCLIPLVQIMMVTDPALTIDKLCAAAAASDLRRLEAAMAAAPAGLGLDTLNRRRLAPLHCAADAGSEECIRALVAAGAQVDAREGDEGKAALHLASQNGDLRCVSALLELGAALDAADNDGWTPLMTAAYHGEGEVLAALLAAGADTEAAAACGRRAAHLAASAGEAGCLAALLRSNASAASTDAEDGTPLHAAAAAGQLLAIRCLLEEGSDPCARDSSGRTPAELAAAAGHSAAAEELGKLAPASQAAAGQLAAPQGGSSAATAHDAPLPAGAALLGQRIRWVSHQPVFVGGWWARPDCPGPCTTLPARCPVFVPLAACLGPWPPLAARRFHSLQGVVARAAGMGGRLCDGVLCCQQVRPVQTWRALKPQAGYPACL